MNTVLIYNNAEGDVVLVDAPTAQKLVDFPAKKGISESMIIDRTELPSDYKYSQAWSWAGTGYPVVEDLGKLRNWSLSKIKYIAGKAVEAAQRLEAIFETPVPSSENIRSAYLTCKGEITAASTSTEIKNCLNTFTATYEVTTDGY
jgi:hypothetical protein